MLKFTTKDNVTLRYLDVGGGKGKDVLILLHGFTGSSLVFQKNIPALSQHFRVIAPDLRGHGESDKPDHGFHVYRLAMDLRELMVHLVGGAEADLDDGKWRCRALGASLGCAVLWAYTSLFPAQIFTHLLFIDQSPLQNSSTIPPDTWDTRFCNRSMNNAAALSALQSTLSTAPRSAHLGTISACLSYLSHPSSSLPNKPPATQRLSDETFFLGEAMKGNQLWFGKLMADHTALDWRANISACLGPRSGFRGKVLVVASSKSGCFPAEGPLVVVDLIRGYEWSDGRSDVLGKKKEGGEEEKRVRGVVVDWGGHWSYWEDCERFDSLVLEFLGE